MYFNFSFILFHISFIIKKMLSYKKNKKVKAFIHTRTYKGLLIIFTYVNIFVCAAFHKER